MKKLLIKLLIGSLAIITMLAGLVGCGGSSSWTKTDMTDWGKDVATVQSGFITETENYYYFINGVGVSTEDNSFGAPVKGALMAVKKDFSSEPQIVVPKLFVASDYKAGLFVYDGYVYYGTPNTDKNSSGDIANNELTFMKTKLDGSESTRLFTLSSLSAEYRILQNNGVVYIVYYDSADTALEVFNCNEKTNSTIIKTDAEVEGENGESLNAYKFVKDSNQVAVYYTVTVYAEDYIENKTDARATASYNKVYAYGFKDNALVSEVVLDGSKDGDTVRLNPATYEMKMIVEGMLIYTETINGTGNTYIFGDPTKTKITNTAILVDTTLFSMDKGIFTLTDGVLESTVLFGDYNAQTRTITKITGATALLAINGDYLYFTDADSGVSRINLTLGEDARVEKVSNGTVFTSGWYPIEFIGNNMFYCDNSSEGASYIKYVDITGTVCEDDTDDDGENDKFYLKGQKFLGQMTEADQISVATAKVNSIANALESGVIPYEKKANGDFEFDANGKLIFEKLAEVEAEIKDADISEESQKLLDNYKKALDMASLYAKLEGIRDDVNQARFESAYNEVKAQIEAFKASEDYTAVSAYIGNNLLWNYQKAVELFAE